MLYTTVLMLEFSPIVFEALGLKAPLKIIRSITIPLVILGVMLSTLHQSTLGTMMTVLPYRIHPLWYSGLLPVYYFLTAVAAGMAMTVFETYHSARTYQQKFELNLVSTLTKWVPYVLGLYLVLRIGELFVTGKYIYLSTDPWPTFMFLIEIMGGVLIPAILFADKKVRNNSTGIVWAAFLTMGDLIFNQFNTSLVFLNGDFYFPSAAEIIVSIGLTCPGHHCLRCSHPFSAHVPRTNPGKSQKDFLNCITRRKMMTRIAIDPITRIEGHLRIEVEVADGKVTKAWSSSTMFRGIEEILKGRDPRSAWTITQRICGV